MKKNSISTNIKDQNQEKKSIQYQIPLDQDPKKIEKELAWKLSLPNKLTNSEL